MHARRQEVDGAAWVWEEDWKICLGKGNLFLKRFYRLAEEDMNRVFQRLLEDEDYKGHNE